MPAPHPSSGGPSDSTMLLLGEMRGQLRELIHKMSNREQKDEAIARLMGKLEDVPERLDRIESRIGTLETDKSKREGERGLLVTILKSPVIQWIAMIAIAAWAYLKGSGQ